MILIDSQSLASEFEIIRRHFAPPKCKYVQVGVGVRIRVSWPRNCVYHSNSGWVLVRKVIEIVADEGLPTLAARAMGFAYRSTLRRALPRRNNVIYNGIIVEDVRWLDSLLPKYWKPHLTHGIPDYEYALVKALQEILRHGDKVVVVGGGVGVTAVVAARIVGPNGNVTCFEGSRSYARVVQDTARRNGSYNNLSVQTAVVGLDLGIFGLKSEKTMRVVPPGELPACDVLQLDCEGAERTILAGLKTLPRAIVVETHGMLGSPTAIIRNILELKGYNVTDAGPAEPRVSEICERDDIRVLVATRDDSRGTMQIGPLPNSLRSVSL